MKRAAKWARIPLLSVAALVVAVSFRAPLPSTRVAAEEPNRAGIVVTFGDGRSESLCVEFSEAEMSGAELLRRSGLPAVTTSGGAGAAVCAMGGVGCDDPNDCFCRCHGADCRYWAYYTLENGAWQYSAVGSSLRKVRNGDVDGWAWGSGSIGSGAKPEAWTFEEICPPAGPAPPTAPSPAEPSATPPGANATPPPASTAQPNATVLPFNLAEATWPPGLAELAKLPTALARQDEEQESAPSSTGDFPWQIPVFAVVAVVLLGTALALAKRRARE